MYFLFYSRFASFNTAESLSTLLGLKFTGPIKTAHAGFPIETLRWTIAKADRGTHDVLKLMTVDPMTVTMEEDVYAIGWSDHHLKCYLTTHGK